MYKKAQIAITDLFIAVSIFLVLIAAVLLGWNTYKIRLSDRLNYDDMIIKSFYITDLLIKNPGKPSAWELEDDSVEIIGLVSNDRNISKNKLEEFVDLDYSEIKSLLNIQEYDFYFSLSDLNDNLIESVGVSPDESEYIIDLKRVVVYENQVAIVEFILWK